MLTRMLRPLLAAVTLTIALAAPLSASAATRPFSSSSFWNKPLADRAQIDARSQAYVDGLRWEAWAWGSWINTSAYSTPVYTVPAGQPTVRVQLDNVQTDLQAAWERVPIPSNAVPAIGTDGHMVVWQPSTDTMWEFWRASKQLDGWHAVYGGRMKNVSTNPGYFTDPPSWGATATSLPLIGGLMRIDELKAGRIDHALAMAIPQARANVYSWPAQRTDGNVDNPDAIPEGTRFRIDPKLDLRTLKMSRTTRIMAEAAQRYGIVVRDLAGSVVFYGEDPTLLGTDPYTALFGGLAPSQLLAEFPWASMQALNTDLRTQG